MIPGDKITITHRHTETKDIGEVIITETETAEFLTYGTMNGETSIIAITKNGKLYHLPISSVSIPQRTQNKPIGF